MKGPVHLLPTMIEGTKATEEQGSLLGKDLLINGGVLSTIFCFSEIFGMSCSDQCQSFGENNSNRL